MSRWSESLAIRRSTLAVNSSGGGADEAAAFVFDDELGTAFIGNHGGDAGCQCLQDYIAEGVGLGEEGKEVHVGVSTAQRRATQHSGHFSIGYVLAQPRLFATLSDEDELHMFVACGFHRARKLGEAAYLFFRRETSNVADDELSVCAAVAVSWG